MAEAKRSCRQVERLAGEYIAGPRPCAPRKDDWIDPTLAIQLGLHADRRRLGWGAIGIVSTGHAHFDVPESFLRKMCFERGVGLGRRHMRHASRVKRLGSL